MISKYLLFVSICLLNLHSRGQSITPSVNNSTGGTATVGNLIFDWNVGESMITTQSNGFIVTNGQLQPVDQIISVEELNTSWNISVYPNPTRDEFVITTPSSGIYEASQPNGRSVISKRKLLFASSQHSLTRIQDHYFNQNQLR